MALEFLIYTKQIGRCRIVQWQVYKVTRVERGKITRTCYIVRALGNVLPPVIIFTRVHFQQHMITEAPARTLGLGTPSAHIRQPWVAHLQRSLESDKRKWDETVYNKAVNSWMFRNPGKTFSLYEVTGCDGYLPHSNLISINATNFCPSCNKSKKIKFQEKRLYTAF